MTDRISDKRCSHGKTFKVRCIDCELILARERLASATDDVDKYGKLIVKLEAEQRLSLAAAHPNS